MKYFYIIIVVKACWNDQKYCKAWCQNTTRVIKLNESELAIVDFELEKENYFVFFYFANLSVCIFGICQLFFLEFPS